MSRKTKSTAYKSQARLNFPGGNARRARPLENAPAVAFATLRRLVSNSPGVAVNETSGENKWRGRRRKEDKEALRSRILGSSVHG